MEKTKASNAICFIRWIIYTQILAVFVCGLLSYLDRHGGTENLSHSVLWVLYLIGIWAVSSIFIYPVIIIGITLSGKLQGKDAAITYILECIIVFAQCIALLPLCQ